MYIEVHFKASFETAFDDIAKRKIIKMEKYDDYFMTEDIFNGLSLYGNVWENVDTFIFNPEFDFEDKDERIPINILKSKYRKRMRNIKIKKLFDYGEK